MDWPVLIFLNTFWINSGEVTSCTISKISVSISLVKLCISRLERYILVDGDLIQTIELFDNSGAWKTVSLELFCSSCFLLIKILIGKTVLEATLTKATLYHKNALVFLKSVLSFHFSSIDIPWCHLVSFLHYS